MDHYLDIKLQPDAEMRENELLNKVYAKFHKALFDLKANDIGISFPEYQLKLGKILRIHSIKERLTQLQTTNWLGGLSGYCDVGEVRFVPANVRYRTISRKQTNMSSSKLKRLVNRGNILPHEMKNYRAKMFQNGLINPFFELESCSNGHKHRRYIEFGELTDTPIMGKFDYFGLSKFATVPNF
jgi:CRISPR-associated endonuclease Csy4